MTDQPPGEDPSPLPPGVRTYQPRRGRMQPEQRAEVAGLLQRYGIPPLGVLDLPAIFAGLPVAMEIGSGMGEATLAMAAADPTTGVLAVDIHTPGVRRLLLGIHRQDLTHVRVAHEDAVALLARRVAPGSLSEVRIFFPDPWPKKRHHKRRLVAPSVVALMASRLEPGGLLHLATDVPAYADVMRRVTNDEATLRPHDAQCDPPAAARPHTRYEQRGLDERRAVTDLLLRRIG